MDRGANSHPQKNDEPHRAPSWLAPLSVLGAGPKNATLLFSLGFPCKPTSKTGVKPRLTNQKNHAPPSSPMFFFELIPRLLVGSTSATLPVVALPRFCSSVTGACFSGHPSAVSCCQFWLGADQRGGGHKAGVHQVQAPPAALRPWALQQNSPRFASMCVCVCVLLFFICFFGGGGGGVKEKPKGQPRFFVPLKKDTPLWNPANVGGLTFWMGPLLAASLWFPFTTTNKRVPGVKTGDRLFPL